MAKKDKLMQWERGGQGGNPLAVPCPCLPSESAAGEAVCRAGTCRYPDRRVGAEGVGIPCPRPPRSPTGDATSSAKRGA